MYAMGLFILADGTHASFDKILARFFWEGVSDKRSYHWVNWPEVCRPKDKGGLGIINSRFFNAALMVNWVWRIFDPAEHQICGTSYCGPNILVLTISFPVTARVAHNSGAVSIRSNICLS
jgi:hypothetical protein